MRDIEYEKKHTRSVTSHPSVPCRGVDQEKESDAMEEIGLYEQCFMTPKSPVARVEPKVAFARVLRQIETMNLRTYARVDLETVMPRGFVFAIHELGSEFVTIGHGGRSHLRSILSRLQLASPRPLEIAAVLQRYSFDDARALCDTIKSGLIMYQTKNKSWYTMENCRQKIVAMFARIDKIEESAPRNPTHEQRPKLLRRVPGNPSHTV
jgi:hypothetical protein